MLNKSYSDFPKTCNQCIYYRVVPTGQKIGTYCICNMSVKAVKNEDWLREDMVHMLGCCDAHEVNNVQNS